jgi:hypothetical protein
MKTSELGRGHAPASSPPRRGPSIHWIGGWVGPRAGLDAVEKKKKSLATAGNRTTAVQPVAHRYIDTE